MTEKEWLNKIKWNANEDEKLYTLTYLNLGKEVEVNYVDIEMHDTYFEVIQEDSTASVPYHRIRKIKKSGKIVFTRRCAG